MQSTNHFNVTAESVNLEETEEVTFRPGTLTSWNSKTRPRQKRMEQTSYVN